jgi:Zn-dependent M28 family amino/carboxypeptidase
VYNGADDDGSGTSALLELAQAFQIAKKEGHGPKRSILFLHVTGEEHGLHGSRFYSENPLFPLENTVADVNIDMIGRRDEIHPNTNNYVYIIGANRLSSDLDFVCAIMNQKYVNLDLDYRFNDPKDPNHFYERSDHYNFAKHGIPAVFFFNGVHADYHKKTDEPDKIEYDALAKRAQLAFVTAWELANRKDRIVVDKK